MMPEMWIKKIIRGNVVTVIFSFFRHTPPTTYDLRPGTYSFFFRLETPFLTFFALLYYTIIQSLIYPFYTNRPRFV